jgi:hypothetical protein
MALFTLVTIGVISAASGSQPKVSTLAACKASPPSAPARPGFTCGKAQVVSEDFVLGQTYTATRVEVVEHYGEYVADYLYGGEFPIPCHWRPLVENKELGEEISRTHTVSVSGTASAGGSISSEVEAGVKLALAAKAKTEAWAQVELTSGYSWQHQVKVVRKSFPAVYICSRKTLNVTRNVITHVENQPFEYDLTWNFKCKFAANANYEVATLSDVTTCWTGEYTAKGHGHNRLHEISVSTPIQVPCIIGPCPD